MTTTSGPRGWIHQVFCSIQGEGLHTGQAQTFVRLAGCNLECAYCDTADARDQRPEKCRFTPDGGAGDQWVANPLTVDQVVALCERFPVKVAALTGGEPLMQADFLAALMPHLKKDGYTTYLETNGTLPDALARVIESTDVVAMDVKLPGAAGVAGCWQSHESFLRVAVRSSVFAKVVVTVGTPAEEVTTAAELVARVDRSIPLVLQPAAGERFAPDTLIGLQRLAMRMLDDVRVIPQCHKYLGLM